MNTKEQAVALQEKLKNQGVKSGLFYTKGGIGGLKLSLDEVTKLLNCLEGTKEE